MKLQTRYPPRVMWLYSLGKIYKPKPVGRPVIRNAEKLIQPVAKISESFIKETIQPTWSSLLKRKKDYPKTRYTKRDAKH